MQIPPGHGSIDPLFELVRAPGGSREETLRTALAELDRFELLCAGVGVDGDLELAQAAFAAAPGRFFARTELDPRRGTAELRRLEGLARTTPLRLATLSPARLILPLDDARCYPLYAKCVELGLVLCTRVGVPPEPVPYSPQKPERIDPVACFFPELRLWMCGDCEPWQGLAVGLMRRHPSLCFVTGGLLPSALPAELLAFAAEDGAHQLLFASGAPLDRPREHFYKALHELALPPSAWPLYARDNAARILKLR